MTNAPELDANGNPITPGGDEVVQLTKAEHDEIVRKLAEAEQAKTNTVEELKTLRTKNAELKAQVENPEVPTTEVEKVVQAELAKKEAAEVTETYKASVAQFLDEHPEFSTENDPGGVKFAAYQKALGRINLGGLKTPNEFAEALNDALGLMERKVDSMPNNSSSAPRSSAQVPLAPKHQNLTSQEDKLVKSHYAGNYEAYLKDKAKRPEYFEVLLQYSR